jgi:hypothetical protein
MRNPLALLALVILGGCDPIFGGGDGGVDPPLPPASCGPGTCLGCCLGEVCVVGNSPTACGLQGEACSDCAGGTCPDGVCRIPFQVGSCEQAPTLTFTGAVLEHAADTTGLSDHRSHQACQAAISKGPDMAFSVKSPGHPVIEAEVVPLAAGFWPALYAFPVCGSGNPYLGCSLASAAGDPVRHLVRVPPEGMVLFVDGQVETAGPFTLSLRAAGTCERPLSPAPGLERTRLPAAGATTGSCGGAGGELVYRVELAELSALEVSAHAVGGAATKAVLYLRPDCGGDEVACASSGAQATTVLTVPELGPGTWHLFVDSDLAADQVDLKVTVTPLVPGDSCSNPHLLDVGAGGGSFLLNAPAPGHRHQDAPSCGLPGAPDRVVAFTTSEELNLAVTAPSWRDLWLRQGTCEGPEAASACTSQVLRVPSLPPGTWYLWQEVTAAGGTDWLKVELSPPGPGDSCSTARTLAFTAGTSGGDAFETAYLNDAFDTSKSSCGGKGGPDHVYRFTTTQVLDLRVQATASGFAPVLSLRTACEGAELACSPSLASAGGTLAAGSLPPGDYWLWLDSSPAAAGISLQYELTASLTPPVAGDTCASPHMVALSPPGGPSPSTFGHGGSTTWLFNNQAGSCGGSGAPDAVYRVELSAPATLTAQVTGSGTYRPVLYLRQACDASEQACVVAPTPGGTATLTAPLAAGSWFVWVDGLAASAGDYTLQLSAQ